MRLHYETVSPTLLHILQQFMQEPLFKEFRLVGGTALSLQRGHRRSIDIDLFTALPYETMPIAAMKAWIENTFPLHIGTEEMTRHALGYSVRVGWAADELIKVDFFYTDPFLFPAIEADGLCLTDERDIAAMKLSAITGAVKRQKDYWDIHELLASYSLTNMIEWALQRSPYTLTYNDIIIALKAIDQVESSKEGIASLRPLDYWELKMLDLQEETERLINKA